MPSQPSSPAPKLLSLVFVLDGDRVLLGLKKRGFGQGNWNGFGGKLQPGETMSECAARELQEESGLEVAPEDLRPRGTLEFRMLNGSGMVDTASGVVSSTLHVSVFSCTLRQTRGEVAESDEMRPAWYQIGEVPLERMVCGAALEL